MESSVLSSPAVRRIKRCYPKIDSPHKHARLSSLCPYIRARPTFVRRKTNLCSCVPVHLSEKDVKNSNFATSNSVIKNLEPRSDQITNDRNVVISEIKGISSLVETRPKALTNSVKAVVPQTSQNHASEITSPISPDIKTASIVNDILKSFTLHSLKGHGEKQIKIEGNVVVAVAAIKDIGHITKMKGVKPTPLPTVLDMLLLNEANEIHAPRPKSPYKHNANETSYKTPSSTWGNLWQAMRFKKKPTESTLLPHLAAAEVVSRYKGFVNVNITEIDKLESPSTEQSFAFLNKTIKPKRSKISLRGFGKKHTPDDHDENNLAKTNTPIIVIDDYDAQMQENGYISEYSHYVPRS